MPKPQEIAILDVNGVRFQDWETVWVQQRWADAFTYFRFTAAERDPVFLGNEFPLWEKLQFRPGDWCNIMLAGQLAVTGWIETRQVAYDANQHGVMLIGKSATAKVAKSSVFTETGEFDGKSFQQIAQEVIGKYPVGIKIVGTLDPTPFDKMQAQKGELIWDFLERLARVRGIVMGSDQYGNFLLIGDHQAPITGQLIEGRNIKSCQCTITQEQIYAEYRVDAQKPASDADAGSAASEMTNTAGTIIPRIPQSLLITPAEQPVKTLAELAKRARTEADWHDYTEISATVIVQGWLSDGVNLWNAGDDVFIRSPMALLNNTMKIQNCTFSQDSNTGTITTLDLVMPGLLRDKRNFNPGP
jgi:prophage tail gpP-like protein